MVKKAVPPAKKAAPATSKPASKATAAVKSTAKSAPAQASPTKSTSKAAATTAPVKAAPAKTAADKSAAKAATPPAKAAAKPPTAKHAAGQSAPAKQSSAKPAPTKPAETKQAVKQPPKESVKQPIADAPAKASPKQTDTTAAAAAPSAAETRRAAAAAKKAPAPPAQSLPAVKGETKEGIKYTKDFDAKFLLAQRKLLIEARESLTGQAVRLEDEANSLIDDEMGDVQFDDESGEGDTMVVERERDLFLSARARQDIEEIDSALHRLEIGTYGYSVVSMRPIPRERLEAIPWATELTEEKVGGIGRR